MAAPGHMWLYQPCGEGWPLISACEAAAASAGAEPFCGGLVRLPPRARIGPPQLARGGLAVRRRTARPQHRRRPRRAGKRSAAVGCRTVLEALVAAVPAAAQAAAVGRGPWRGRRRWAEPRRLLGPVPPPVGAGPPPTPPARRSAQQSAAGVRGRVFGLEVRDLSLDAALQVRDLRGRLIEAIGGGRGRLLDLGIGETPAPVLPRLSCRRERISASRSRRLRRQR